MTKTYRYLADHLIPMDDEGSIHSPGVVDVEDGAVVWAGTVDNAPSQREETVIERVEGVLLPGMVNIHCHTPMVLLRGAGENLPVDRWLHEVMWPREARLTPEDVEMGMMAGAAELLAGGITTSLEMYFHGEAVASGAARAGLRCLVTAPLIEDAQLSGFGTWQDQLDQMTQMAKDWEESDLIQIGIGPHAVYSLSQRCLQRVAEAAAANGMLIHTHVDEQEWEVEAVRKQTGMSATAYLAKMGILDSPTMVAHAVWVSPDDIAILAETGTGVAHCPCSNGKHASGIAPVAEMRAAGIPVGIATDGPASHHRLDLFEEMRMALRLARIRAGDAGALLPHDALTMVTREAADAIGRPDLGRLSPGNPADMIAVSTTDPAFGPVIPEEDDPLSRLVWSGSPAAVHSSWVGGKRVMSKGKVLTVDMETSRADVSRIAARLATG